MKTILFDVSGCARCGGQHPGMEFSEFRNGGNTEASHWAWCPNYHEPIFLRLGDSHSAGMAWSAIAASMWRAGLFARGDGVGDMSFASLPLDIRTQLEAMSRQVGYCLEVKGDGRPPDEQRWRGWKIPGTAADGPVIVGQQNMLHEIKDHVAANPDGELASYLKKDSPSEVALHIAARVWCDQEMGACVMDSVAAKRIALIVDEVRRQPAGRLAK